MISVLLTSLSSYIVNQIFLQNIIKSVIDVYSFRSDSSDELYIEIVDCVDLRL